MRFLDVVLKNVFRRKVRSSLTALSVAVGVGAVTALVSFSTGLQRSSAEIYHNRNVDLVVIRLGVIDRLTSSLKEELQPRLASLPGVVAVAADLKEVTSLGEGSLIGVPVHGQRADEFAITNLDLVDGRRLMDQDHNCVMLGRGLSESLHRKIGDKVDIESQRFQVVGIFHGINVVDDFSATVLLPELQELMDRPKQVSEFQLRLDDRLPDKKAAADELTKTIADWKDESGGSQGLNAFQTEQFVDSASDVRLSRALAWICSIVALLVGGVGMLNTMTMAVLERTQEIGVLRAIGWKQRRVGLLILCEAQLLSMIGALIGVVGGSLLILAISRSSYSQGLVSPNISGWVILCAALLAPAVGLLGGSYPALRASRLQPVEALRYE